jgi:hypothetical protein
LFKAIISGTLCSTHWGWRMIALKRLHSLNVVVVSLFAACGTLTPAGPTNQTGPTGNQTAPSKNQTGPAGTSGTPVTTGPSGNTGTIENLLNCPGSGDIRCASQCMDEVACGGQTDGTPCGTCLSPKYAQYFCHQGQCISCPQGSTCELPDVSAYMCNRIAITCTSDGTPHCVDTGLRDTAKSSCAPDGSGECDTDISTCDAHYNCAGRCYACLSAGYDAAKPRCKIPGAPYDGFPDSRFCCPGLSCVDAICVAAANSNCTDDQQCSSGVCYQGVCAASCRGNNEPCETDSHCCGAGSMKCYQGQCRYKSDFCDSASCQGCIYEGGTYCCSWCDTQFACGFHCSN